MRRDILKQAAASHSPGGGKRLCLPGFSAGSGDKPAIAGESHRPDSVMPRLTKL